MPFSVEKLRRSLERSKATDAAVDHVIKEIMALLHEGMTTKEIYKKAFALLRKTPGSSAARYKLKSAIMELGPAGFAFEKFVAEVLKDDGYRIELNVMEEGACVKHELDIVAERANIRSMIECKFHSDKGKYSDVKIPLYIQSRFKDVEQTWLNQPEHQHKTHQGWVVTNTRFTTDATQYAACVGLKLISWDYPKEGSLKQRVDNSGLHPITCLTSLTRTEHAALLSEDQVLCSDLVQNPGLLDKYGISPNRRKKILQEARGLCGK